MARVEQKYNLLLLDADVEFTEAVSAALSSQGFSVTQASDVKTALGWLAMTQFDMVMLDRKMTGLDGGDVLSQMRAVAPRISVIVLMGRNAVRQAFVPSNPALFEYITQTCDVEQTIGNVRRQLARKRRSSWGGALEDANAIRLLLVDDEPDFLESVAPVLRRRNIEVTTAQNAEEAIGKIHNHRFDVAVVDIRMPGRSGLDLLVEINKLGLILPVIILTGQPSMGKMVKAVREGAFDILQKPQSIETLTSRIQAAYRHKQEMKENQMNLVVTNIFQHTYD